jgi:hypothetical protein
MKDNSMKWLLILVSVALFANAAAIFYQASIPKAYAQDKKGMYIEGGKLNITISEVCQYVGNKVKCKPLSFVSPIPVKAYSGEGFEVKVKGDKEKPLHMTVDKM